jgi:hypothetical protein
VHGSDTAAEPLAPWLLRWATHCLYTVGHQRHRRSCHQRPALIVFPFSFPGVVLLAADKTDLSAGVSCVRAVATVQYSRPNGVAGMCSWYPGHRGEYMHGCSSITSGPLVLIDALRRKLSHLCACELSSLRAPAPPPPPSPAVRRGERLENHNRNKPHSQE